jgi:DNA topoisomerase VI subunit B
MDGDAEKVNRNPPHSRRHRSGKQADTPATKGRQLLFAREDWSLYTSLATLPQRAGVTADLLARLTVKELTDNGLDSADAAGRPGAVTVSRDAGNVTIDDQGTGIAGATPEKLARLFCVARPMLSSKLLRRASRGAIGNGLRACLGYLTATRGRLVIETGSLRVELVPESNGTSRILNSTTIAPRLGLRLTAVAGDAALTKADLMWAEDAVELARQSGRPAFTGRTSPHWHDADHFHMLLLSAVGDVSVRQLLGHFDGCTGSRVQSDIAARFLRRPAASLSAIEAAELLAAMQSATTPPKARALRPLGRNAVVSGGYAIAEGSFTEGTHKPRATIPFIVECWADAYEPGEQELSVTGALYMNRTMALAPFSGDAWHARLDLELSGTSIEVPVPAGPRYNVVVNITSPMFRLTSDAKTPDCDPFTDALTEAVGKASKQAGRDISEQITSEEKRKATFWRQVHRAAQRKEAAGRRIADREARRQHLAQIEAEKAQRQARPTITAVVLELMPEAAVIEGASDLFFNTRRIVYRIRDEVLRRTLKELVQGTFDKILTAYEAEHGDLHPLLIREARGNFRIPHHQGGLTIPLGTLNVRGFRRPAWTFNKIVVIEKEDLRFMLEQAGWDFRHDALLMSAIGFNTRAARDLIDNMADTTEPLRVFNAHDGDAAGTVIQHTLQHATLARGARKIEVVNIGLEPWEGIALGLAIEKVPPIIKNGKQVRRAVGQYVLDRADRAPTGETWEAWLQHSRVELNAMTSAELIQWLDKKMKAHGAGKLIPPGDILTDGFGEHVRKRVETAVADAVGGRLRGKLDTIEAEQAAAMAPINAQIAAIEAPFRAQMAQATATLRAQLADMLAPFEQRTVAAHAQAAAVDNETEVAKAIAGMTPAGGRLQRAIAAVFRKEPMRRWAAVLEEIAQGAKVGTIKLG